MLSWLGDDLLPHKRQLFACACVRRVWRLVRDEACRRAVEAAERFADGLADAAERDEAVALWDANLFGPAERAAACAIVASERFGFAGPHLRAPAAYAAFFAAEAVIEGVDNLAGPELFRAESAHQARLLRCVAGNPFRAFLAGPWVTPAAVTVAKDCYQRGDFAALPLLADLLEEAGCPHQSVLDHCRGMGPHTRGCHAIDAVLSRA
jgi:hypothetical protein